MGSQRLTVTFILDDNDEVLSDFLRGVSNLRSYRRQEFFRARLRIGHLCMSGQPSNGDEGTNLMERVLGIVLKAETLLPRLEQIVTPSSVQPLESRNANETALATAP